MPLGMDRRRCVADTAARVDTIADLEAKEQVLMTASDLALGW